MGLFDEIDTVDDVQRLLIDDMVEEGDFVDYKQSHEWEKNGKSAARIAKCASAFANAGGGLIVFGVKTRKTSPSTLPEQIVGIPQENIALIRRALSTHVRPVIEGVRWKPINVDGDPVLLLADIPSSPRAPHQEVSSLLYYRRVGDESKPMTHDLVELYFGRRLGPTLRPRVERVELGERNPTVTQREYRPVISIENVGAGVARDVLLVVSRAQSQEAMRITAVNWRGGERVDGIVRDDRTEFRASDGALVVHPTETMLALWILVRGHEAEALLPLECATIRIFADRMAPSAWTLVAQSTILGTVTFDLRPADGSAAL